MTPKLKLALLVLGMAFLSALITLFFQMTSTRHFYPMPIVGLDEGVSYSEPMSNDQAGGWGKSQINPSATMEAPAEDVGLDVGMIESERSILPLPESILPAPGYYQPPIYYRDDALDVDQRAVEMFSSQSVVVSDVGAYLNRNQNFIKRVNGRVLSYQQGTQAGQGLFARPINYGYLDARVPMDKFEEVNQQLGQNVQKVVYQSVSAQDVTGQVVAIDEQLQKLQDQLAEAQLSLEDANSDVARRRIESEIARLESQIESVERSQQNVEQKVTYATISLSVANSEEYFTPTWRSSWANAIGMFFSSFYGAALYIGLLVIWTALYSLLWLPIMLGLRWVRRKMTNKIVRAT